MTMRLAIHFLKNKLCKILGILSKIKKLLTMDAFKVLYYSLIFPYLQYCNLAWGSSCKTFLSPLVTVQKRMNPGPLGRDVLSPFSRGGHWVKFADDKYQFADKNSEFADENFEYPDIYI